MSERLWTDGGESKAVYIGEKNGIDYSRRTAIVVRIDLFLKAMRGFWTNRGTEVKNRFKSLLYIYTRTIKTQCTIPLLGVALELMRLNSSYELCHLKDTHHTGAIQVTQSSRHKTQNSRLWVPLTYSILFILWPVHSFTETLTWLVFVGRRL
ncbi:hypothetical protein JOB18_040717 [Solea senegalensis]|uniref:Uncharacterized protein n=1 Tax=Solea senegalensis TaxID=28829 RepID=A0AAV6SKA6_SOLSE|nr:hypothetical protein JOB18_040717 [Solea senegalensis]